jgi:hypothetical protein
MFQKLSGTFIGHFLGKKKYEGTRIDNLTSWTLNISRNFFNGSNLVRTIGNLFMLVAGKKGRKREGGIF